jgi:uncharacterized protein YggU (UPF0235/DUF167 family)
MTSGDFFSVREKSISLKVKARPGAGKDGVLGVRGGELVVAVRAVAEKGKANEQLIRVLSDFLGVPRDSIRLKLGGSTSHKVFELPREAGGALTKMKEEGT